MYKRPNGGRRIEGPVHDLHYRTGLYKGSFEDRNRPGGVRVGGPPSDVPIAQKRAILGSAYRWL